MPTVRHPLRIRTTTPRYGISTTRGLALGLAHARSGEIRQSASRGEVSGVD